MRIIAGIILSFFMLTASPAHAQFGDPGGLGDILEDILKQGKQTPPHTSYGLIDNIPVTISVQATSEVDLTNHTLVLEAYAPAKRSGTFEKPAMLGQTQLLLTGLTLPLNAVVAVPTPVMETLDYARIEAKIIDENGNPVREARSTQYQKTDGPLTLVMDDVGYYPVGRGEPQVSGLETIQGKVRLADGPAMFRGSLLTLQLIENDLAGGMTTTIAAETLIDLDQKTAPFDFKMERGLPQGESKGKYALKAWITDWAGRKTHVMETPIPYNGPDRKYSLTLDTYSMSPPPVDQFQPSAANTIVSGEARFDAYKGLPSGSILTATLTRAAGAPGTTQQLATRSVLLDGLSGNVKFDLVADSMNFDPYAPAPTLSIRITDSLGRLFFSAANVPVSEGRNIVTLSPSAAY